MGLLDKLGDVFDDVKDAVVDAAPVLLPIALSYFGPTAGMSLVARQALGAGIGSLIKGDDPEKAMKSAVIGGALGAVQGGIGGVMDRRGFGEGVSGAFQGGGEGILARRPDLVGNQDPRSLGSKPTIFDSLFYDTPSRSEILGSPELEALRDQYFKDMPTKDLAQAQSMAIADLTKEYTPTNLQRFGVPAAATALALTLAGDEEEDDGDDYFLTGADIYEANPEDYRINLYREGGVASVVPNKYKGFSKLPEEVQLKISPELAKKYAEGGEAYPRRTGGIGPGEGSGTKDDVPALLMDGEFVMTREAVKGAGNGSIKKGINRMYDVMRNLESKATA